MAAATRTRYPGVYKRDGKRGVKYDVSYRDDEGKQRWRTFPTLAEARGWKQGVEVDVRAGEYVDDRASVTVEQYATRYLAARAHNQRPATRARQASMVATHVTGTKLGKCPVVKVRKEHIDEWLGDRSTVLSRSTLRTLASLLRAVLTYAVENRVIRIAPTIALGGKRRTVDEDRVSPPSVEEVRRLAAAMPTPTTRALVIVQAGTGLRISELLALRGCDVSVPFRTVKVTAQLSRRGERMPTKTPESERTVPMSDAVGAVIADLTPEDAEPDALLFSSAGCPIRQNTYHVTFKRAAKSAGLPATLSSHDLRHHFATTLLRAGLSPVAVGKMLGHTDGSLVVRTYGHWMPADDDVARAALDAAWSGEQHTSRLSAVQPGSRQSQAIASA